MSSKKSNSKDDNEKPIPSTSNAAEAGDPEERREIRSHYRDLINDMTCE
jgi:hypothetical protein